MDYEILATRADVLFVPFVLFSVFALTHYTSLIFAHFICQVPAILVWTWEHDWEFFSDKCMVLCIDLLFKIPSPIFHFKRLSVQFLLSVVYLLLCTILPIKCVFRQISIKIDVALYSYWSKLWPFSWLSFTILKCCSAAAAVEICSFQLSLFCIPIVQCFLSPCFLLPA